MAEFDERSVYALCARLDNARNLSSLLKGINFKEVATVVVSAQGLKFTLDESRSAQANAFFPSEMFQEYSFRHHEDSLSFRINLNVLLDCLGIFGSTKESGCMTSLKMCYEGYGFPLILVLVENEILTHCKIITLDTEDVIDLGFTADHVINKIIMRSEYIKEIFQELDMTSDVLEIHMSPGQPYFRISTYGVGGSTWADFPKDSEMVEVFECKKTLVNRYKMAFIKPSTKALALSSKFSVRTDDRGVLSFQYMIINEDKLACFIEYMCIPDETVS